MGDKVTCQICKAQFKKITGKHIKQHGLSFDQYIQQYPGFPLISESSLLIKKQSAIRANSNRRGIPRSDKVKKTISETKKQQGLSAWNKGIPTSIEHRTKLSNVKKTGYDTGSIVHWNLGKQTPISVREKISKKALDNNEPNRIKKAKEKADKLKSIQDQVDELLTNLPRWCDTFNTPTVNNVRMLQSFDHHCKEAIKHNLTILGVNEKTRVYTLQCNVCKHTFFITCQYLRPDKIQNRSIGFCPQCHPREYNSSEGENQLYEFIKPYFRDVVQNDRSTLGGYELDVLIPSINVAFEYTGNYWHSEQVHPIKQNVLHKHNLCKQKGITLITIFEDEWLNKSDICKSRILNKLKIKTQNFHARKCTIQQISHAESKKFLEENHIQGSDISSIRYGAFLNDQLMAVMTFKKTNFSKGGDGSIHELSRFCLQKMTTSSGLATRMFKRFISEFNPPQVISYSDNRWNSGEVYNKLGFVFECDTPPSFWYIKKGTYTRYHRSVFMKHVLERKGFDLSNKTAAVLMEELGYNTLWDCGSKRWRYINTNI